VGRQYLYSERALVCVLYELNNPLFAFAAASLGTLARRSSTLIRSHPESQPRDPLGDMLLPCVADRTCKGKLLYAVSKVLSAGVSAILGSFVSFSRRQSHYTLQT